MAHRLVQNFVGLNATIISSSQLDTLKSALSRAGVHSNQHDTSEITIDELASMTHADSDIIIIDGESDWATAANNLLDKPPFQVPVIGLVGIESPSRLKGLMRLGMSAVIRKPVHGATIYPALFLAVNVHRKRSVLEEQIAENERRRRNRRFIMKAILIRMQDEGIDDDAAYENLRREAMRARLSIEEYCELAVHSGCRLRLTNATDNGVTLCRDEGEPQKGEQDDGVERRVDYG